MFSTQFKYSIFNMFRMRPVKLRSILNKQIYFTVHFCTHFQVQTIQENPCRFFSIWQLIKINIDNHVASYVFISYVLLDIFVNRQLL